MLLMALIAMLFHKRSVRPVDYAKISINEISFSVRDVQHSRYVDMFQLLGCTVLLPNAAFVLCTQMLPGIEG